MEREEPPIEAYRKLDAKLAKTNYQGFLRDLRDFVRKPSTKRGTELQRARLRLWVDDRFNPLKYYQFLETLFSGPRDDAMFRKLVGTLLEGGENVLDYDRHGAWTFGLYGAEVAIAGSAFGQAKRMARCMVRELTVNPKGRIKALLRKYFSLDVDIGAGKPATLRLPEILSTQESLRRIREVFSKVAAGFGEGHQSVILCKSDGRSGSNPRITLGYVDPRYPIHDGAMIFLGDGFFQPLARERGCTILHEATHLFAGTDDVMYKGDERNAYGRDKCSVLPQELAFKNADSYALFAEDLYQHLLLEKFFDVKLETW
jgi:hypothetical protein